MNFDNIANRDIRPAHLALGVAEIRSQALGLLMESAFGADEAPVTGFAAVLADRLSAADSGGELPGLALGRNLSLADPESAYRMMSLINGKDVVYKAEFSELSEMAAGLAEMRQAGLALGGSEAGADVRTRLEEFVTRYNAWIDRFDAALGAGGLLGETRAAQVARYELEQSIGSRFHGVGGGIHGLADLGLRIDPASGQATLDARRLDAALAGNEAGVVGAVREFGAHFARSAELLNADGNFIPNRLDNLDRAIDYIADNLSSLQAEFGLGDPARPAGEVARALAAYRRMAAGF